MSPAPFQRARTPKNAIPRSQNGQNSLAIRFPFHLLRLVQETGSRFTQAVKLLVIEQARQAIKTVRTLCDRPIWQSVDIAGLLQPATGAHCASERTS